MPVLHEPARPRGSYLPSGQRVPALTTNLPSLPDREALLELLTEGELSVEGRLTEASNATLYCTATLGNEVTGCVYKPIRGEKPLWDFPTGTLALRETAAYRLAAATGLDVVPPTVLRDGPFGPGSVQWWVSGDPSDPSSDPAFGSGDLGGGVVEVLPAGPLPAGWLHVLDAEGRDGRPVVLAHADDPTLRRMALFDAVANNTDRKGGHILRHAGGAIFGVDHGLTFNEDDKLRTVLWGWAGQPLGEPECGVLEAVVTDLTGDSPLREALVDLLSPGELARTARRAARLLRRGRFPQPPGGWPAIPWPPF